MILTGSIMVSVYSDVNYDWLDSQVRVKVTLRLTVSQSISLGVESHLGLMNRYLLLFDSYGLGFVGRPLWREDGSVFCTCSWPLPAQYFSGLSPLVLATIFYCLQIWDFPFHRFLRLAGWRWRYSAQPPHGYDFILIWMASYIRYQYSRNCLLITRIHGNACWSHSDVLVSKNLFPWKHLSFSYPRKSVP
jgi:hypothetical protein